MKKVLLLFAFVHVATIDIHRGEFTGVLQKALFSVTVTFPWLNHTTAVYYSLSISGMIV